MTPLVVFMMLAIGTPAFGTGVTGVFMSEKYTLQSFKEVSVFVQDLGEDATRNGLTKERLLTDVELKLRKNGIPIVTMQEWLARVTANSDSCLQAGLYDITPTVGPRPRLPAPLFTPPELRINVDAMLHHDGLALSYSIDIQFRQSVVLIGNQFHSGVFPPYPLHPLPDTVWKQPEPPIRGCSVATWERGSYGFAGTSVFAKTVRESVLDQLDYFINDWLAVNGPNARGEPNDGKE